MTAYYNEIDPYAAQWLRNLIAAGHIAPGDVDERSIEDVRPDELAGYTQCHFFAGIGGWSYALRLAGWPDAQPVWTGSCPCQPFSAAGKGAGTADERHLWPAWHHLIRECGPAVIFGEQVEAAINHGWLDLVQDDLEGEGYAFGTVGLPAASVGAPHIRQRLWFVAERVANSCMSGSQGRIERGDGSAERIAGARGVDGGVADALLSRRTERWAIARDGQITGSGEPCGMADTCIDSGEWNTGAVFRTETEIRREGKQNGNMSVGYCNGGTDGGMADTSISTEQQSESRSTMRVFQEGTSEDVAIRPLSSDGFWRAADWLYCRDGKWRPVESGTFPLAHGVPGRVGRLRAYGNAISPPLAAEFIKAYLECKP